MGTGLLYHLVEADMEEFINWDNADVMGRVATLQHKQDNIETQIVYAEIEPGYCDARDDEAVLDRDRVIGVTSSGGYGYVKEKSLVFSYVDPGYAEPGATFAVEVLGKRRSATIPSQPA